MGKFNINEIEKQYNFELDKIVSEIKKKKAKIVLLQFPDGLKPYSTTIVDFLEKQTKETNTEFLIWIDSCFGACDTPILPKEVEKTIDLVFQFGHNEMMPSY